MPARTPFPDPFSLLTYGSLGITVMKPQIWWCERAKARSHHQIWDLLRKLPMTLNLSPVIIIAGVIAE